MTVFIVKHGEDNPNIRGGWSDTPLTDNGIAEIKALGEEISKNSEKYNVGKISSSDIVRASQTAQILSDILGVRVEYMKEFREVNNGVLAGMGNSEAEEKYPNLYWSTLEWEEKYPDGESPKEFYERVKNAWYDFTDSLVGYSKNVMLITHGGVINVIKCLLAGTQYSNKVKYERIPNAEIALSVKVGER